MKKLLIVFIAVFPFSLPAFSQSNLGINNSNPPASAALMIDTAATGPQGMLIPRMTLARRNAIAVPATALMVYQTDNTPGFYYYNGAAWTTMAGTGGNAGTEFMADKAGGTGETLPLAGSLAPATIIFNNVVSPPATGAYNSSTGVFTIGAGGAGTYMIQVKLLTNDASPVNNTVSPYITLIKNNATYGSTSADVFYGDYPMLQSILPTGIRGQGSLLKIVKFAAGDNFKIVAVGANSGVAAQAVETNTGCNITIVKIN